MRDQPTMWRREIGESLRRQEIFEEELKKWTQCVEAERRLRATLEAELESMIGTDGGAAAMPLAAE